MSTNITKVVMEFPNVVYNINRVTAADYQKVFSRFSGKKINYTFIGNNAIFYVGPKKKTVNREFINWFAAATINKTAINEIIQ